MFSMVALIRCPCCVAERKRRDYRKPGQKNMETVSKSRRMFPKDSAKLPVSYFRHSDYARTPKR